jgi:hypothetical protein
MKNLIALTLLCAAVGAAQQYTPQYTTSGELLMPKDYREWVFLTSGLGMTYSSGPAQRNPTFGNVWVNPAAHRGFLKTGMWPDKTVMLIENRASDSKASINKDGRFQTSLEGFEVHVKDAARGGWAFYFIAKDAPSGKLFPKTANCYSCHEKSGSTDTTFVQFYPTLIETAKKKGTYKETGE